MLVEFHYHCRLKTGSSPRSPNLTDAGSRGSRHAFLLTAVVALLWEMLGFGTVPD